MVGGLPPPCLGDCNNSGIDDMCEATPGPKKDCNFNDTLDGCEIEDNPALDCNNNSYIDSCEIEDGAIGDCNDNAIPDDCDLSNGLGTDCNHNGIPDGCDLSLGIVPDCNNNGLPDDCEGGGTISGDCNFNGTLDTCDIDSGTSADTDGNCVPDECDPKTAPQGELDPTLKNRYLSFTPANAGCSSAIRIKLTSLYHPEPDSMPRLDISAFEGEYRWLGPPSTYLENQSLPAYHFTTATTQCNPYFTNWNTINMLNIMGDVIVPSSHYEIQMVDQSCADLNDSNCYSDPLIVSTGKWGDVSEPFVDEFNLSQPNIADILSLVDKWLGTMNPPMVQAQLQPNIPDPSQNVGIADILYDVDAWLGVPYPLDGPTSCNP